MNLTTVREYQKKIDDKLDEFDRLYEENPEDPQLKNILWEVECLVSKVDDFLIT